MSDKYGSLREQALANAELLFDYWQLDYVKVNKYEYDFLNPTRKDTKHGACRFNVDKGRGADFAGSYVKDSDITSIFGPNFTREDFQNIGRVEQSWSFDIIGLCQRLHRLNNYNDAAKFLEKQLNNIKKLEGFQEAAADAAAVRLHKLQTEKLKRLQWAERIWRSCKSWQGTLAETYFQSRSIKLRGTFPSIKFHPKIYNSELKGFFPAVLFKVSDSMDGALSAIHRIYLDSEGNKLNVSSPKVALGNILGCGIWFGDINKDLCVAEGPENALSLITLGYGFVVSTVFSNNFSNLNVKGYNIKLFPDPDTAGRVNTVKAEVNYRARGNNLSIVFPPKKLLPNGKLADWNDIIMGKGEGNGR
jgi:hypothetical protein